MKAVLVSKPGGPDALDLVDLPVPAPGPGQVQITAKAFGVSTPDALIRSGVYAWMPPLPANPGNDLAGVVTAVGAGVASPAVGDKVLLSARDLPMRGGCYAEVVCVAADVPHPLAPHVDLEQAVCLPNYQVAQALLQECGHPRAPRSVLVVGAAGGEHDARVQRAQPLGHAVTGRGSTDGKGAFAPRAGGAGVVFYRREDLVERVLALTGGEGVGRVYEHAGGPAFADYVKVLGAWGTLVSFNGFSPLPEANLVAALRARMAVCPAVRSFSFPVYDHARDARRALMRAVIGALERGEIAPAVGTRLPLEDVRRAHALLEAGTSLGKIVMTTGATGR
ncbi:MAG TPA: zinc-binding dehydrogenase [Burkholderiaceae bacterium]|nr:zinc-binding dehydrogenase [Burkholderiaceae bacterium]